MAAFRDPRNAAELLLAPAQPASRKIAKFGSLKLGLGSVSAVPGAITSASDITGAVRHSFSEVIKTKTKIQGLSTTLSGTLSEFDANRQSLTGGTLVMPNRMFTTPTTDGIPSAQDFLKFSSLPPGRPVPASFQTNLLERKTRLQALTARMSTIFAADSFKGVTITENFNRTAYPLAVQIDKPSIPLLAQGGSTAAADPILKDKRRFTVSGVTIAAGKPNFWSRLLSAAAVMAAPGVNTVVNQLFKDKRNAGSWSEPTTPYAAQFPYNKVQQSESGHVIEIDDTPGAERVHIFHRSGSFIEFHPNGTVVYKNLRDGYDLTMGDKYVKVAGACHISVDGKATLFAKGNVEVQSDGDININAKKDFNVFATNINLRAKKTFRGDGRTINLRYISLPTGIVPVPMTGALAPRVNIAALKADFPGSNVDTVLSNMAKNPLDPRAAQTGISLGAQTIPELPENPLSNPGVYALKTGAAIAYRARFFDTPEETEDFELYNSHIGLQKSLGDITDTDPRSLGGKLYEMEGLPTEVNTRAIDYLNYDDYKGNFSYTKDTVLANTSFTLGMLVDMNLYPTLVPAMKVPPAIATEDAPNSGTGATGGGAGGGGGVPGNNSATGDRGSVINGVAGSFQHLLDENTAESCAEFSYQCAVAMNAAYPDERWGLLSKSGGEHGYTWPNGVRTSHDVICRSDGTRADIVTGADNPGVRAGTSWSVVPGRPGNVYVDLGDVK